MNNKLATATSNRKKLLIDMDGVLANFTGRVFETFRERYGDPKLDPAKQEQFYVADYFNQHLGEKAQKQVEEIQSEIGFFLSLQPLPSAKEKIKELSQWYDTYILTSPLMSNPSCASEKIQRIRQHLWDEMAKKVIIAKDKSMVLGDILIDDHPTPCNETQATRKHLLFDQPYNQNVEHKPRMHRRNDENLLQLIEKMVLSNK